MRTMMLYDEVKEGVLMNALIDAREFGFKREQMLDMVNHVCDKYHRIIKEE